MPIVHGAVVARRTAAATKLRIGHMLYGADARRVSSMPQNTPGTAITRPRYATAGSSALSIPLTTPAASPMRRASVPRSYPPHRSGRAGRETILATGRYAAAFRPWRPEDGLRRFLIHLIGPRRPKMRRWATTVAVRPVIRFAPARLCNTRRPWPPDRGDHARRGRLAVGSCHENDAVGQRSRKLSQHGRRDTARDNAGQLRAAAGAELPAELLRRFARDSRRGAAQRARRERGRLRAGSGACAGRGEPATEVAVDMMKPAEAGYGAVALCERVSSGTPTLARYTGVNAASLHACAASLNPGLRRRVSGFMYHTACR